MKANKYKKMNGVYFNVITDLFKLYLVNQSSNSLTSIQL